MLAWSCYWRMLDNWRIHERGHSRQGARTQSAVSFACLFGCLVFSHACSHLVEPRLTISLPWVRRGFTTKLQHKRMAEKSRNSAPARYAVKMRLCRSRAVSVSISGGHGMKQPLDELAKLVGIDAAQQNNRESPGAGRGMPSTAKRGSESGRTPPSRESVAQEGRRSNTG